MKQKKENCTNENTLLTANVANVFVVKNAKNRAFIEQFQYSSVNFTQRNLGTILGFFVVRDYSSSSENIVNYLASEVKKQYFAPTQKPVEEKFELTLHHTNRVLEEIAKVGNVDWLGHIDGVVCVITDDTIHMSVTGNAHVLLLRDNTLQNISEGLASEESAQYPLKTFVDIASGPICPNDKIIITSQELLDLIPLKELERNAIRFGQDNFIQFVTTALTNECEIASATIVDITSQEIPKIHTQTQNVEIPDNFFGADAFDKSDTEQNIKDNDEEQLDSILNELGEEHENEESKEYVDEKTGHIYIQGPDEVPADPTPLENIKDKFLNLTQTYKDTANKLTKKFNTTSENTDGIDTDTYTDSLEHEASQPEPNTNDYEPEQTKFKDEPRSEEEFEEEYIEFEETFEDDSYNTSASQKIKVRILHLCKCTTNVVKNTSIKCIDTTKNILQKKDDDTTQVETHSSYNSDATNSKKHKSFLPSIHNIKILWNNMSKKTRWTTLGIILAIIIIPLSFAIFSNKDTDQNWPELPEESPDYQPPVEEIPTETIEESQSQETIPDPKLLLSDNSTVASVVMNDENIAISKNTITVLKNKEGFNMPNDAGDITVVAPMNDLDLLFILTTKDKLYTFSPTEKKFTEQKSIPKLDHTKVKAMGTYMTYLYTLEDKMITRYARIENGFEEGVDWLKDDMNLTNATTFAIDDNIYIAIDGKITKLTKGNKAAFTQDSSIANAKLIYTTEDTQFMWILDTQNKTLYKTKKDAGTKIEQYQHDKFSEAETMTVNEKENTAIISTLTETLSFQLSLQ